MGGTGAPQIVVWPIQVVRKAELLKMGVLKAGVLKMRTRVRPEGPGGNVRRGRSDLRSAGSITCVNRFFQRPFTKRIIRTSE